MMDGEEILVEFVSGGRAGEEMLAQVGVANPFCAIEYARAIQSLGREVWIAGLRTGASGADVALGFISRGRLNAELEFPSLPVIAGDTRFWDVVYRLCERAGVTDIVAGTFGSPAFNLPTLCGKVSESTRQEFILRLGESDLASRFSSGVKKDLKRARHAGLTLRRTRERLDWLSDHIACIRHSAERRIAR